LDETAVVSKYCLLRNEGRADVKGKRLHYRPSIVGVMEKPTFHLNPSGGVNLDNGIVAGVHVPKPADKRRPLALLRSQRLAQCFGPPVCRHDRKNSVESRHIHIFRSFGVRYIERMNVPEQVKEEPGKSLP